MMMTSYIALDLETTGLESKTEKITEAAALKVIDGTVRERFVTLINPGRPIQRKLRSLRELQMRWYGQRLSWKM